MKKHSVLLLRASIKYLTIKTHDSESQDQEEAGRTRQTSELFTCSTAVKFVDALDKPPLNLLLSYVSRTQHILTI